MHPHDCDDALSVSQDELWWFTDISYRNVQIKLSCTLRFVLLYISMLVLSVLARDIQKQVRKIVCFFKVSIVTLRSPTFGITGEQHCYLEKRGFEGHVDTAGNPPFSWAQRPFLNKSQQTKTFTGLIWSWELSSVRCIGWEIEMKMKQLFHKKCNRFKN